MNDTAETCEVAIIGTGFSGLAVAIDLQRRGIDDVLLLERADAVGGTWRDNVYPGCAVDVPSALYSYSFFPGDWSRLYAPQPELRAYTEQVVDRFDLRARVRLNANVVGADFDEDTRRWRVSLADGRTVVAGAVVMGYFSLHVPSIPDLPGRAEFAGPQMHSSAWDREFDAAGQRVAVVGSGASAVQIVPGLLKAGAEVVSYQRNPAWVLPRGDRPIPRWVRTLLRRVPPARWALRAMIFLMLEGVHLTMFHPRLLWIPELLCRNALRRSVSDRATVAALLPNYRFGCKRPMISDEYYAAFARPEVSLVTDKVVEVTPTGLRNADGTVHAVDAIVWATGFRVQDSIPHFPDFRTPDTSLHENFRVNGFTAYRGIAFAGLPNLFCVTGPNTALPHTSQFLAIEATAKEIARTIAGMRERGATRYTPTARAQRSFVERCRRELADRVWSTGGCTSYFVAEDGTNTLTWPGGAWHLRLDRARRPRRDDWELAADSR